MATTLGQNLRKGIIELGRSFSTCSMFLSQLDRFLGRDPRYAGVLDWSVVTNISEIVLAYFRMR